MTPNMITGYKIMQRLENPIPVLGTIFRAAELLIRQEHEHATEYSDLIDLLIDGFRHIDPDAGQWLSYRRAKQIKHMSDGYYIAPDNDTPA